MEPSRKVSADQEKTDKRPAERKLGQKIDTCFGVLELILTVINIFTSL
jgi:hypothetical protein